jgi:hypothetical protein
MKLSVYLLILIAVPVLAVAAPVEVTFHVAPYPRGNDMQAGTAAAPYASLARAQRAVRSYLAQHELKGDVAVEIAQGVYELDAPLRFEPEDSGKNGFAVVYRAATGANVVLSGGRKVSGWSQVDGGVFEAKVPAGVDFRQLWIGGQRAVRARRPNAGQTWVLAKEKQDDGFDLPREALSGATVRRGEVEMAVLIAWMHKRLRIARVGETGDADSVRAVIEAPEWDAVTKQPQGDRVYRDRHYWLENAPEFLDAPGEFYLDRTTGTVRYAPRPDEDMSAAAAIRPELENLVVLAGRPDAPVHDLRFEGLTLMYTGWTRPNRFGFVDVQANSLISADVAAAVDEQYRHKQRKDRVPAALEAYTADRVTVRFCRFARLGGTGVMFLRGGNDNVVEGNSFYDLSAGAIEIGEDAARPRDARVFPRRNRVANNFIARIGEEYFGSVAILGYYTDALTVAHNEIANLPYTAVSLGWGWGTPPAPAESRENRIVSNFVSNYLRRLDDGGGLYTTDRMPGSEIAGNVVERMLPPNPKTPAGGALYLDQCTEGVHVHDNVVTGAIRWLNIWNANIRNNRVESNYADTTSQRNDGTNNVVEAVYLLPALGDRDAEPDAVKAIRRAAGIEEEFAAARRFVAVEQREDAEVGVERKRGGKTEVDARPNGVGKDGDGVVDAGKSARAVVVSEAVSVDFEIVSGNWIAAEPPDRRAATVWQSADRDARARWTPVLPVSGEYEVSVWCLQSSGAAKYVVHHDGGETAVVLGDSVTRDGSEPKMGWRKLGRFRFDAGVQAKIEIQQPAKAPVVRALVADTIRFTR